jgi:hypothetical protein
MDIFDSISDKISVFRKNSFCDFHLWAIHVANYFHLQKHRSNDDFSKRCCDFQACQSILEKVVEGSQPQLGSQDVFFCFVDQYYR